MSRKRYLEIVPQVVPLLPREAGETHVGISLSGILSDVSFSADRPVQVRLRLQQYESGIPAGSETVEAVWREDGKVEPDFIERRFAPKGFGLLSYALSVDRACIDRPRAEVGYALLMRPNGSAITINPAHKYAETLTIDQIRETRTFCRVHTAHLVDSARGIGNSALLANPYAGPLVARLSNKQGKVISRKIDPYSIELVSLEPLIAAGEWGTVMYSGSHRYPGWDVRHRFENQLAINNIDHLEYYRVVPLHRKVGVRGRIRNQVRHWLRRSEIWF